ncbi:hypothetical protein ACHAWF_009137 [Thalassiosira exigua]
MTSSATFWRPTASSSSSSHARPGLAEDDTLDDDDAAGGGGGGGLLVPPSSRGALPIAARRTQILRAVELHGVMILVGKTGCGKSTQLPRYLWENWWASVGPDEEPEGVRREIVCTQPRRLAATTLAGRAATEVGNPDVLRFMSMHCPG